MQNETRYLYSINPKRVIKFLGGVQLNPPIRVSKSLNLTKSEVLECLKSGSVYRRFANEGRLARVTLLNVDRLHQAKFMTESEYEKTLSGTLRGTTVVESKVQEEKPVIEETPKEIDEVAVEDKDITAERIVESPEEVAIAKDAEYEIDSAKQLAEVATLVDEEVDKDPLSKIVDTKEEVVEPKYNNNNQNKNYAGKNKHHRK